MAIVFSYRCLIHAVPWTVNLRIYFSLLKLENQFIGQSKISPEVLFPQPPTGAVAAPLKKIIFQSLLPGHGYIICSFYLLKITKWQISQQPPKGEKKNNVNLESMGFYNFLMFVLLISKFYLPMTGCNILIGHYSLGKVCSCTEIADLEL